MDWKLELIAVPVSDVDRAKAFYTEQVGLQRGPRPYGQRRSPLRAAHTARLGVLDRHRKGLATAAPGSVQGLQLVVGDVRAARAALVEGGVDVSEVEEFPWGSFVFFSDPHGNGWGRSATPTG